MNKPYYPLLASFLALLPACESIYPIADGQAKARMKTSYYPSICEQGEYYKLPAAKDKQAFEIPANSRVTFAVILSQTDLGGMTTSCFPHISFIPKSGATYFMEAFIKGNLCYLDLVREDKTKEAGVVVEPSIGGDHCHSR